MSDSHIHRDKPLTVAVIGGGFTGMTAARRLAREGCSVTLYEAAPGLGGLASGVPLHGTSIETTYHHLFNTDTSIIELSRELGVEDKLGWHPSSVAIYRDGAVHPFMGAADLLRFSPLTPLNRIRVGLVALYLQRLRKWQRLSRRSAYDWMRSRAGGQASDVIWEPLLRGKFHCHYRDVSMAWLWSRLSIRGGSRGERKAGEQLGYFEGGFAVFAEALEADMRDAGVRVRTSARIARVSQGAQGWSIQVDGDVAQYDRVLATVPSYVLAGLLGDAPEAYLEQLRSVDYIGAVVAVFSSPQDLGDTYWVNVNEPDAPFLVFLQHTNLVSKEWYDGRHVYYIGTYVPHDHSNFTKPDQTLIDEWFGYLKEMYPEFDRTLVETMHLGRYRNAQHIPDTQYEDKMPDHRTPMGGLYLANFSQLFPVDRGTNFAVRDGERLASMIRDDVDQDQHEFDDREKRRSPCTRS